MSAWLGHADVTITARVYCHHSTHDAGRYVGNLEESTTTTAANAAAE